ncbi:MAG: serine/threonine protein kinase [Desulfobacterales bacterium]|uniref:Serine/threonine protein kinase n=1 Tax=Candidatus Desulfaltia bathyphila TaxID=2841697 RepID=A0A8J6N788_9BACT|nr:serine/threonine protein kinase [Candidatus Desulfaltia bathyphila]MBL7194879.1 serine/threonine protein kinase [Desulfobacterales bacterium]MBL7206923.1 serine/threonine protein kinase [Desulfobacterales bacterium]
MEHLPDIKQLQDSLKGKVDRLSYLNQGGFKAVYKGYVHERLEAIKVVYIPADINKEDERIELIGRVKREIEALDKCKSPEFVHLGSLPTELININGIDYILYSEEFLDGENLRSKLKQNHKPDLPELIHLTVTLLKAIKLLKENDLIHRDIKPGNTIKLKSHERPFVILDLGVAFKIHGTALTRNSMFRPGTLPYMAPEMFNPRFRENLDYRSDMYSAGVTVYEYASGVHPIRKRGEDAYTTMYRILKTQPQSLSTLRPDLPSDFCKIIDQLIKKLPALRPASIQMLLKKVKESS